jgi:DNA polymerase theta
LPGKVTTKPLTTPPAHAIDQWLLQGSAADVLKLAVWKFQCELNEKGLDSYARIILLIHDEVLVEVHQACFISVKEALQRHLENVCELLVPLKVKLSVGATWGSLEELPSSTVTSFGST